MRRKKIQQAAILVLALATGQTAYSQNDLSRLFVDSTGKNPPVTATFKSDYIVNAQSNETLYKRELRVNIAHRFDDIGGSFGGVKSFFGLDNSTDIKIEFDYGINDRLTAGLSRSKGSPEVRNGSAHFNSLTQLWEAKLKFRLLQQSGDNHIPLSLTLYSNAVVSGRPALDDSSSDVDFKDPGDRWSFLEQLILARKFGNVLSLALLPTYIRRNLVGYGDMNDLFALGIGGRIRITSRMAFLIDYFLPFRSTASREYFRRQGVRFYHPLALGLEIETGGHVFHINFSNSTAILENQFIPYTTRSWTKGEFRWGFNIARTFTLSGGRHPSPPTK